uniref:Uncharacterized protein n=1 Tax=Timema bartmani TaxID=61472 RepID=A0A7R9ER97_9NEOP|nr:unnamed protein product [Timema bartmani]
MCTIIIISTASYYPFGLYAVYTIGVKWRTWGVCRDAMHPPLGSDMLKLVWRSYGDRHTPVAVYCTGVGTCGLLTAKTLQQSALHHIVHHMKVTATCVPYLHHTPYRRHASTTPHAHHLRGRPPVAYCLLAGARRRATRHSPHHVRLSAVGAFPLVYKCSPHAIETVTPHARYLSKFSSNYKITIGADFSIKSLQWDKNTKVNLQLWDIAGHERFGYLTRVMAAAVVFDLSRLATFQSIEKWLTDLRDKVTLYDGSHIPVILLANKCDIHGSSIQHDTIARFCKERDIASWFLTSAKENINIGEFCSQINHKRLVLVEEAITYLVEKVIHIKRKERSTDAFFLRRSAHQEDVQVPMRSCCN